MNELDVFKGDDGALRELSLFAGAGGGILGGTLLGWETACAVECDVFATAVLAQRQNDKTLHPFAAQARDQEKQLRELAKGEALPEGGGAVFTEPAMFSIQGVMA